MAKKKSVSFKAETLDELLVGQDPTTVLSSEGLLGDLKQALAERMLNAEMDVHLDSETEQQACNHRNGSSQKTVLSEDGELVLSIPRDRHGRFDLALIAKYQRRFPRIRRENHRPIRPRHEHARHLGVTSANFTA